MVGLLAVGFVANLLISPSRHEVSTSHADPPPPLNRSAAR